MNKKLYSKIYTIFIVGLLFTCTDESEVKHYSTESIPGTPVKLGKRLKNPFKVSVMKKALENIRSLEYSQITMSKQYDQLLS